MKRAFTSDPRKKKRIEDKYHLVLLVRLLNLNLRTIGFRDTPERIIFHPNGYYMLLCDPLFGIFIDTDIREKTFQTLDVSTWFHQEQILELYGLCTMRWACTCEREDYLPIFKQKLQYYINRCNKLIFCK